MKKFHIAVSTSQIADTIADYSARLGAQPCVVVPGEYALWRTEILNFSVRQDPQCPPGELRHLGWEDSNASAFTLQSDVNGIVWECFAAEHQAEEINNLRPHTDYAP